MDDSEFQDLSPGKNDFNLKLVNLYSPNDKALFLDSIPTEESNYLIVVGDFNSHSQRWGYDHMDRERKWRNGKMTTSLILSTSLKIWQLSTPGDGIQHRPLT
ncbi:hypothetical protein DPMN_021197 [Dreissena polymorpha]|uniref:Endonuclease/exonuclease/phosphatase domain-containing protein n=1 Tax=Dreissena polymorpha TaxID=45954 RepID=A0A9D4SAU9_DREPO|nr:hypothetical protein DPMN_021197 [Dreissena polymorpha]